MAQKETLSTRVARLEQLHEDLAVKMAALADAQIRTEESFQQTDERIDKLVIAIGELISRLPDGVLKKPSSGGSK